MRFLHTSDWHLGTTLGRVRREADHDAVIEEIVAVAEEAQPDVILHTGDLFDHARPAVEDLNRGVQALGRLATVAPVVVIAGNHDSAALFEVLDRVVGLSARLAGDASAQRIRFVGAPRRADQGGVMVFPDSTGAEEARIGLLPFVHPNALVKAFDVDDKRWTGTYSDRINVIEQNLADGMLAGFDPTRHVALFAAHLHVSGATWSGSERKVHVGDDYATKVDHLPTASYAAFGHIHRPQVLPGGVGRYAGSPIQIDFGELGEEKSVVVVDAGPGRSAQNELVTLSGGRPLVSLSGTIDQIAKLAETVETGICRVVVDVDASDPTLTDQISELLPKATIHSVTERLAGAELKLAQDAEDGEEHSVTDQFREFLAAKHTSGVQVDAAMKLFETLLGAGLDGDDPPFTETADFELPDRKVD